MDLNLHLCCGEKVLDGWVNLDPRSDIDPRITQWTWADPLPAVPGMVAAVAVSYGLMFAPRCEYRRILADIHAVLRPGGVFCLREDDADLRVWREPGTVTGVGTVRSTSTPWEMRSLLEDTGFVRITPIIPAGCLAPFTGHRAANKNSYRFAAWKVAEIAQAEYIYCTGKQSGERSQP